MNWPKGKPRPAGAGRKPGTRNKRQAADVAAAQAAIAEARAGGLKLGKEICVEFTNHFARWAAEVRPTTQWEIDHGIRQANPRANEEKYKELSAILLRWLQLLMPFQSAKFQSIRVDVGEIGGDDIEEVGALEALEKLLDAYSEAQQREHTIEAQALPAPPARSEPEPAQSIDDQASPMQK